MNKVVFAAALLLSFTCIASPATQMDADKKSEMDKLMSLMRAAGPYAPGMGKSGDEVCKKMADDMVTKYGSHLSQLGKSPTDIRDSSYGLCVNAISSAENARSENEVEMWKTSALKNVEDQLQGDTRAYSPREFLIESINNSVRIARPFYFMKELSVKYNVR
ncbi:hypothetical protein SLJ66_001940 [Escherichia coli]|nr:hypothetical protein [Escherichia coli]